jgi:hypothetical protein
MECSGRWAAVFAVLASCALMALPASSQAAARPDACTGAFEGAFLHGKLTGLSLTGSLTYEVHSDGKLVGLLTASDERRNTRKVADVTGTVGRTRVTLRFTTASGLRIKGTGSARGVRRCASKLLGKLTSARNGSGAWRATTSSALYIPAPSFSYVCGGNTLAWVLFGDGRIYSCEHQAFFIA